mgnify:CR=1 FL=1
MSAAAKPFGWGDDVRDYIRTIPDFPKPGIQFRDVMPLFGHPRGLRAAVDRLVQPFAGERIQHVAGLEARGFIIGGACAHQLSAGFLAMRKQGKLPGPRIGQAYALEYGEAVLEVHDDAIEAGEQVLILPAEGIYTAATDADFWLLDYGTDHARAALMSYTPDGAFDGFQLVDDPTALVELDRRRAELVMAAVPLNTYVAGRERTGA